MPLVNLAVYKAAVKMLSAPVGNALAINAEGVNGASNSVFTDSSSYNHVSTKTGKIGIGPQSPYYDNTYGVEFNGTTSYVRALNTENLNLNNGDWTIDGSFATNKPIVSNSYIFTFGLTWGGSTPYTELTLTPTGYIIFAEAAYNTGLYNIIVPFVPNINQFYHFAIVRRSNVIYFYIDGTLRGTTAWSTPHQTGMDFNVGCLQFSQGTQGFFPGIVSNVRIVKNIALYTSDFTPPITPPEVNANTSLLLCCDRTFKDVSLNKATVVVAGLPKVVNRSPYKPVVALPQYGGSAYFDGSSYIDIVNGDEGTLGTGAFCLEAWIYPTDNSRDTSLFGNLTGGNGSAALYLRPTGRIEYSAHSYGIFNSNAVNAQFNAWNHIVCCRNTAGLIAIFINGVRANTISGQSGFNMTTQAQWRIGAVGPADNVPRFKGNITGVRVVKGDHFYDPEQPTLTVPTAPGIDAANTSFLYNFANSGLVDHSLSSAITSFGSAQISTTKFKKGTSSLLFNGTTDYLEVQASANYEFFGDFTVEFWVDPEAAGGDQDLIGNYVSNALPEWTCIKNAAGKIQWFPSSLSASIQSSALANDIWTHVALVRIGTTCTLYVDGISVGTMQLTGTIGDATQPIRIGSRGSNNFFKGNIDDVQITNGKGRYTENFTPAVY